MSKIQLPRRLFLRGAAGVTVGLPLLEGLGGASNAKAQQAGAFRYAVFMRQANGVVQPQFWPSQEGALTVEGLQADLDQADRAVGVLAPYAAKMNVVHGLRYRFSGSGCGHADGCFQCLTAANKNGNNSNRTMAMGPSIDWVISQALDPEGVEPVSLYAGQTSSFLGDVILYRGPEQRRAGERDPMNAYQRLFGMDMGAPGGETVLAEDIMARRKSVNDIVRAEMQQVMARPELSADDRVRLDAHFSAIRDLEVEVVAGCTARQLDNVSEDDAVDDVVRVHSDLIALAMACGKSHAATLCIGNGNDQTQYTVDGVRLEKFHHISHRVHSDGGSGPALENAEEKHHAVDKKFAGYYKYLLDKLSEVVTPTGTLLDDGVAIWLNDLSDGPPHGSTNVPWVLTGACSGALRTGQYVRGEWTINRIHNVVGAAVGLTNASGGPLDDFGDADYPKGHVEGLLA